MMKLSRAALLLVTSLMAFVQIFAQAPIISYPAGSKTFYGGVAGTPITPTNTGGAVSGLVVSTFAGTGSQGTANGTAAVATFGFPKGVVFDASGNLFVADTYNNIIRKITAAGEVSTFAGSGGTAYVDATGTAASIFKPLGIAIDASGNLYVTDGNSRIRKITPAGVVSTFAGSGSNNATNGTGTAAGFNNPNGLGVDASGNVYVADYSNYMIRKITSAGLVSTFAGSTTSGYLDATGTAAKFYTPAIITVDVSGNVYVGENYGARIRKITPAGVVTTIAGNGGVGSADGTGTAASFNQPAGLAIDAAGNLYLSDALNHNIRKITAEGVVSTVAGLSTNALVNGSAAVAQFNQPSGLCISAAGDLLLADAYNHAIRKIKTGKYSISPALPAGLSIDQNTGVISGVPIEGSEYINYTVTATNVSGSGTAVVNLGVVYTPPGNALNFDGVNDYVYTSTVGAAPSAYTLEAWFKTSATTGGPIVGFNESTANSGTGSYDRTVYMLTDGKITFGHFDGGGKYAVSTNSYNDGIYHHVAASFSAASGMTLYIDGVLVASNFTTGLVAYNGYWKIGGMNNWGTNMYFNGIIDEVRIWSTARSLTEIQNNMYGVVAPTVTGLTNYFKFDLGLAGGNNTGLTSLTNATNTTNNGILSGFTLTAAASSNLVESYAMVVPVPTAGTNYTATGFTANWTAAATGTVTNYLLDVSTSPTFATFVSGFNGLDCGTSLSQAVTGLTGSTYYYRVLAKKAGVTGTGGSFGTPILVVLSQGNALNFDGINDHVYLPTEVVNPSVFTLEAWFKTTTTTGGGIVGFNGNTTNAGGNNDRFIYMLADGRLSFGVFNGAMNTLSSPAACNDGRYHHVAATFSAASGMKLYVDGALVASNSLNSITAYNGYWKIGGMNNWGPVIYFNGTIDEVRIWNTARSLTEIQANMANSVSAATSGLTNYFKFDQGIAGGVNTGVISLSNSTLSTNNGVLSGFTLTAAASSNWVESYAMVVPIPAAATNKTLSSFTASWTAPAMGIVTKYLLDVSTSATFASFVTGYNALDCGTSLSQAITGLTGSTYYYRVRADKSSVTGTGGVYGTDITVVLTAGNALSFDGVNDYVYTPTLVTNPSVYTLEAWFKTTTTTGGPIVGFNNATSNTGVTSYDRVVYMSTDGKLNFAVYNVSNNILTSTNAYNDGRYHHVAGSYSAATGMKLYVDGLLVSSNGLNASAVYNGYWKIGGMTNSGPNVYFNGAIDEVRIWGTVRSLAEIQSSMYNGISGATLGLTNYFKFDQGVAGGTNTGETGLPNSTLTTNNGVLSGFALAAGASSNWVESYAMAVPLPTAATGITSTGFTANWTAPVLGAVTKYLLDVSTSSTFATLETGYNALDCGTNLTQTVTGLVGTTFYYRVRADKASVTGTGGSFYSQITLLPGITTASPDSGAVGTVVTITGTGFSGYTGLTIGGVTPLLISNTATSIVAMVMPGSNSTGIAITSAAGTGTRDFPVTETPFPSLQQGNKQIAAGNIGAANQGWSVGISGDGKTAIVGGPLDNYNQGAAWIYTLKDSVWMQQGNKLVATTNIGAAKQGSSVAISADGNTAIVGGSVDNNSQGAAWVWIRTGTTWAQQAKLVGTGTSTNSTQGTAVALSDDGNTALLSAPADNGGQGAVIAFIRSGTTWSQQGAKLVGTGSIGAAEQSRALALSSDGNTAIVGAYLDNAYQGAAWVYTRSGGIWSQQGSKLVATGNIGAARHGYSVSLSADGNTALIGGNADKSSSGAAWVWTRTGTSWSQQSKLIGSGSVGLMYQGESVSLSADGNTAVVSGYYENGGTGALWVFTRTGSSWSQRGEKLLGTQNVGSPRLGCSISLSRNGKTVLVGGYKDNSEQGAVWMFSIPPLPVISSFTPTSSAKGATVTLTGKYFLNASAVSFGGTPAESFRVVSSTTITAIVAAGATGVISVTTPSGIDTSKVKFTYIAPAVQVFTGGTFQASYQDIKFAFDAINAGTHTGDITVKIVASQTLTASAVLYGSGRGSSSYTGINIYPVSTGISILGSLKAPLIDLNGADNVTFDGRVSASGTTNDLIISNTAAASTLTLSTIRFINGATGNTVKYCTLKGSFFGASEGGTLYFGTTTTTTGNSNNTIDHNNITCASNTDRPTVSLASVGSTEILSNARNTISNNNFYDFLSPTRSSSGINIGNNTSALTISGNSFYETLPLAPPLNSNEEYTIINIFISSTGEDYTIANNFIGGSEPACGGTPFTKTGTGDNVFTGINLKSPAGKFSNIQGNTISNFSYANKGSAVWKAINIGDCSVWVNVGTTTGNIIGGATGTDAIVITDGGYNAIVTGLGNVTYGNVGKLNIENNIIGAITVANTGTDNATSFYGMYISNSGSVTVSNNTIGSLTTANSITASSPALSQSQSVNGIYACATTGPFVASGNTIANLTNKTTNPYVSSGGLVSGIYMTGGTLTLTKNTLRDFAIANASSNTAGVGITIGSSDKVTLSDNIIYNVSNSNPSFTGIITGISYGSSGTESTVSGNFIHDLSVNAASTSATINGLVITKGPATFSHNIISLGGNTTTTLYGIFENISYPSSSFYFNSVYIGGSPTAGSSKSTAFYTRGSNTRILKNNVFYNARSNNGATGSHYAINLENQTSLTSDYNDYYAPGTGGKMGRFGTTDKTTLPIVAGQDAHSLAIDPLFTNAGGTQVADYKTAAVLPGLTITGFTQDFAGTTRAATPTMGVYESTAAPSPVIGALTIATKKYGDANFTLSNPVSNSAGTFSFASSNTGVATIVDNVVTIKGAGTSTITATQAATSGYSAGAVTGLLTANKASQTLTLSPMPTGGLALNTFTTLAISAGSSVAGLTPTIRLGDGSAATLNNNSGSYSLSAIGSTGTVFIYADQPGNSNYYSNVLYSSFDVTKGNQAITFDALSPLTYASGLSSSLTATTSASGLSVGFAVISGPGTISGNTLSITGAGTIKIEALQAGNGAWNAATSVTRSLLVNAALPTISSFTPARAYRGQTVTITGTNFDDITAVIFGGNAENNFERLNATTSTAIPNGGATGSVTVTSLGGDATKAGFTYLDCTPDATNDFITACGSYTWHGVLYTASNNTAIWAGVNAGGCDSVVTLYLTILPSINPTSGGTIAGAQTGNSPFDASAFTSTTGAAGESGILEYQWQSSTTDNSTGFSEIAGTNSATYDAGELTVTTWFKRLARVTCSGTWAGAAESNVLEVTVITCINPSTAGEIAADQSGTSPFDPSVFTSTVDASGQTGTLEYKWQSSSIANGSGFYDIAGSNAATYNAGVLTDTTWFIRLARVTCQSDWTESNILEVAVDGGVACDNPTNAGEIAAAQSGTSPFNPVAFTSSSAASGEAGTLEYKWQSLTIGSDGFGDIAGSNAETYDPGSETETTWYKRLARVGCKIDWTGAAESNILQVTIIAACINPTSGGTIAAAQTGISPFNPAAFSSSVAASGETGTLEYKWQSSTTGSGSGFSDIAGSNAATHDEGALTHTTWFKRLARVTCSGAWSGAAESNVLEVTVTSCTNPSTGGTIAAAQSGLSPLDPAAFTSSVAASGQNGILEYKWQSSTTGSATGFTDIVGSDAATYDAGAVTETIWFKRLARADCMGNWTGAAESNVLKINILALDPEPLAQPTGLFFTNSGASTPYNLNLNYTASATASGYLVVRKTFAAPTFVPVDGSTYAAGAQGSDTIVYVGSATSVADLAVNNLVDYHYKIYAFNGSGATINYLNVHPLMGKSIVKISNSEPMVNTSQSISAGFPGAGVNITFPNGTTGSTITASKTNSAPASNFSVLPGVRGVVNQYFTITSTSASAGIYTLTLDFSSLGLTPDSKWASFKILKRTDATAPWVDITTLGGSILNRQTDGVWGKFTITGLSSFSEFTGGAEAVTTTVTTTSETGPGSLKQAIANATAGDFINFDTTLMGGKTITLTSPVVIDKDLTIMGANGGITLNGSHATRVMDISDAVVVRLDRLKIANGYDNLSYSGGIWNNGSLTMVNCVVSGNAETGVFGAGGILQYSMVGENQNDVLNLINCTITGNTGIGAVPADGVGGLSVPTGIANIYNTIIYGNTGDASSDVDVTNAITLMDHSDIGNLDSLTVTTSTANISSDPGFAGAANAAHPFAITGSSPAADAGSNSACVETTDIRCGSFGRKINKTDGTSGTIDMGAYEFSDCLNPTGGGVIAAAQSGVSPLDPAAFTSTSGASGQSGILEYKWQSSTTSASGGFSDIVPSDAATYDAGALTVTTWFKRLARVTCSADWTGAPESNVLKATVITSNTWTGTTNNNFNTGTNWSYGTVPTSTDNFTITTGNPQLNVDYAVGGTMTISGTGGLTINAGKTLSVDTSGTADFGGKSVTIKSDATGTGAIGQIAGTLTGATNVTVERYIATAKRAWRFLTVPVTGQTLRNAWAGASANATAPSGETAGSGTLITGHGIASGATAAAAGFDWFAGLNTVTTSSIRYYSTAANWSSASNTPSLLSTPDKNGYMLFVRGDRTVTSGSSTTTLRPTGTLKTGTQTMAVNNAYEVIGNPYASSIDLDAVYNSGSNSASINRNFWVWDATLGTSGAYRALSFNSTSYDMAGGSGSAADYLKVQSGQAFFVEMKAVGNVTIEEANKTGNASVNLMGAQPVSTVGKLAISLYQATGSTPGTEMDGVLARFGSAFQTAGTDDYDVAKISNFNENMGLLRGNSYLSIESRPYPVKTDTLFAPFWNLTNRAYALKLSSTGINGQLQGAKLLDAFTKTETALNLNEGGTITYPFSVTSDAASSSLDRFIIVMTVPTSLPVSFTSVNATPITTGIDVTWKTGTEINVKDYIVERSGDGLNFTALNNKAAMNATAGAAYNYLDLQPLTGKNYYRIRSNDKGGDYHYSAIATAQWNGKAGMGVFPTAVTQGQFTVQLANQPAGTYKLALTTIAGRKVYGQSLTHAGGSGNYGVKTGSPAVSTGVYQLTITVPDGQQQSFRLLISSK